MMIFWWIVAYFVQLILLFTAVWSFFQAWWKRTCYLGDFGRHETLASNIFKYFSRVFLTMILMNCDTFLAIQWKLIVAIRQMFQID